ncbi:MAG: HmuY family protein [Bacteroidota bacterium]
MKKLYSYLSVLTVSVSLIACFPEIDKVPMEKPSETIITAQSSIYNTITFFKIYENITAEVVSHELGTWDMAFQSAMPGDIVLLNYTVSARAIRTGTSDFSAVDKNTVNELFNADGWMFNDPAYSNNGDSTALKDWEDEEVYLVYRGSASLPDEAYYKVQFISKTQEAYTFKYAHVEDTQEYEMTINRTFGLANVYFSFEDHKVVDYEPNINDWEFYFTPYFGWYETLDPGIYSPYNVKGVMINNEGGVMVSQVFDEAIAYEDIDLAMAMELEYTDWKGAIGSTWKNLPPSDGSGGYTMDTKKKYVIKLSDGNIYKLRFLDYYNNEGEKGYTSFEMILLE